MATAFVPVVLALWAVIGLMLAVGTLMAAVRSGWRCDSSCGGTITKPSSETDSNRALDPSVHNRLPANTVEFLRPGTRYSQTVNSMNVDVVVILRAFDGDLRRSNRIGVWPALHNESANRLFPGRRPGQHLNASTMRDRLRRHGFPRLRPGRHSAVATLVAELPAPLAADVANLHPKTTAKWIADRAHDRSSYARRGL